MLLARTAAPRLSSTLSRTILGRTVPARGRVAQNPASLVPQQRLHTGIRHLGTQRLRTTLQLSSFNHQTSLPIIPPVAGIAAASLRWKGTYNRPPRSPVARVLPASNAGQVPPASSQSPGDTIESDPQQPRKPLPDLRHGIPSTFADEYLKDAEKKQYDETAHREIDITDAEPEKARAGGGGGGGRGDGEIPKSAYESSIDRRRNRMAQYFYISVVLFGVSGALWAGRDWDTEEEAKRFPDAPSGWGFNMFYNRIQARIKDRLGYYTEPAFPKLLPILTDQPMPPYTLVLSLEDMLVHSEWTREHGWRTAKRPGIDFFILYLSQYYELCLFTSVPSGIADPVYKKLDPYHLIQWPLFREATRYEKGQYIKDLAYLNRPLKRTILLDTKEAHAQAQPENAIIIPPWTGDPADRELIALIPFLEYLAVMGIEDVRGALKSFKGTHIPSEFAAREAKMREAFLRDNAGARKAGGGGLKSLADRVVKAPGQGEMGQPSLVAAAQEGKTPFDVMRAEGMKRYRLMEKEIRENGERWLRDEAELMKRLEQEQMRSMKSNPFAMFGFGAPAKPLDPAEVMAQLQREKQEAEGK